MRARFMFCRHSRSRFQSDGVLSRLRFDHQRDFVFGVGIVGRVRGFDGDGFDLFGGAFGLQRRGFGIFGNVGSQNVRPFIGRALLNGGGFVGFNWGNRFSLFGFGFGFAARVRSGSTD